MKYFSAAILFSFLFMKNASVQSLEKHQWNNRLILILTQQPKNDILKKQLTSFRAAHAGMNERKLLVYQITPEKYRTGTEEAINWQLSDKLFSKYKKGNNDFEILLIGLDGGIKLRQNKFLSTDQLFALIDSMPMRRAEMRSKF
ncbi:MAG: DUF4174 domain-containing protein [Bacteroidota bacterium]